MTTICLMAGTELTKEKHTKQARFLAALLEGKSVTAAAATAGAARRVVYDWRDQSPSFRSAWDDAIDEAKERTLAVYVDELKSRALDREDKTSHLLLMFLIKQLDPSFRDNYKTEHKVVHETVQEISFSQEEFDEAIGILQEQSKRAEPSQDSDPE